MSAPAGAPAGAPSDCPGGPGSEGAGTSSACAGCPNAAVCASGAPAPVDPAVALVAERLRGVSHKLLVLSGKGGVGKSTFSAQLALTLAARGRSVGLLDVDICGPSIPRMMGLEGHAVHQSASGWSPVWVHDNLAVMSIGFLLPSADEAVIWRGPRKNGLIRQVREGEEELQGRSCERVGKGSCDSRGARPSGSSAWRSFWAPLCLRALKRRALGCASRRTTRGSSTHPHLPHPHPAVLDRRRVGHARLPHH